MLHHATQQNYRAKDRLKAWHNNKLSMNVQQLYTIWNPDNFILYCMTSNNQQNDSWMTWHSYTYSRLSLRRATDMFKYQIISQSLSPVKKMVNIVSVLFIDQILWSNSSHSISHALLHVQKSEYSLTLLVNVKNYVAGYVTLGQKIPKNQTFKSFYRDSDVSPPYSQSGLYLPVQPSSSSNAIDSAFKINNIKKAFIFFMNWVKGRRETQMQNH